MAALKITRDGGRGPICPPIAPPPPPCPPLGLLPEPHRARVTGVSSAHHEEVGGASCIFREPFWFHHTMTSRPMPRGAYSYKCALLTAMCTEGAIIALPRELLEPLKRGPLGGGLRISIPCGGIGDCVCIIRVQSFAVGARLYGLVIDHVVVSCWGVAVVRVRSGVHIMCKK